MLFKKIGFFHLLPLTISIVIALICNHVFHFPIKDIPYTFSIETSKSTKHIERFFTNDLTNQIALSYNLKRRVPVLFGSSELTSVHLNGLAFNFFNNEPNEKLIGIGTAGFQNFAILSVLAANKPLIKDAKLAIILSPGWFEKQYCSGTKVSRFLDYCPPNYMYQISQDTSIDEQTSRYIRSYLYKNYDKISKPDAAIRFMSKKNSVLFHDIFNFPFLSLDKKELEFQKQHDPYLISQHVLLTSFSNNKTQPFYFKSQSINWDSLNEMALTDFKKMSNNNDLGISNEYYDSWIKGKPKKVLYGVDKSSNTEYQDFLALVHFLKVNNCKPIFIIMPLNMKTHENLEILQPIINDINLTLKQNNFKSLDMFSPNVTNFKEGLLEDVMHPYEIGWYQMDKFILENFHDN